MLERDTQIESNGAKQYGCTTIYNNDEMKISRKWYSLFDFLGILVFVAVFNGVWVSNNFLTLLTSDRGILLKVFALLFIGVGASAAYFGIAFLFNKTIITVKKSCIEVRHRPIPWLGNTEIERSKIVNLIVREKHYLGSSKENTKMSFQLLALTMQGEPVKVLTGLKYGKQALHIKKELEVHLGFESDTEL